LRAPKTTKPAKPQLRFGIGEWYGQSFAHLSAEQRQKLVQTALKKGQKAGVTCPFQSTPAVQIECNKAGGVCSLRLYRKEPATRQVTTVKGAEGQLRTVCPLRFEEDGTIYRWVGETVLGYADPLILGEIGFLEFPPSEDEEPPSDVGRIDKILVVPNSRPLSWCALEVQAVYFQGRAMRFDFDVIRGHKGDTLPFPEVFRRPDYRSSGPKDLCPNSRSNRPRFGVGQ
jgi:hypothetical protein